METASREIIVNNLTLLGAIAYISTHITTITFNNITNEAKHFKRAYAMLSYLKDNNLISQHNIDNLCIYIDTNKLVISNIGSVNQLISCGNINIYDWITSDNFTYNKINFKLSYNMLSREEIDTLIRLCRDRKYYFSISSVKNETIFTIERYE